MQLSRNIWDNKKLIEVLKKGGIAVIPTDTIYGITGSALNPETVENIYKIKKRTSNKPLIILIGNITDLDKFSIKLSEKEKEILKQYWFFGKKNIIPTTVVFDYPKDNFFYLHRGEKSLAFRVPHIQTLRNLLKITGPLVAPSANLESLPPSEDITQARVYFKDQVDLYIDGGEIKNKPSRIIRLYKDASMSIIRK